MPTHSNRKVILTFIGFFPVLFTILSPLTLLNCGLAQAADRNLSSRVKRTAHILHALTYEWENRYDLALKLWFAIPEYSEYLEDHRNFSVLLTDPSYLENPPIRSEKSAEAP